ncbi:MAG: hypothetical protein SOI44_07370 [Lactimicrobium sp.]|jgi:hypothetical protein|uniref:hypothetical protein n=1 Tax=Lactimicrobium sp. TaxID=2563780 RepID=UPI002F35F463
MSKDLTLLLIVIGAAAFALLFAIDLMLTVHHPVTRKSKAKCTGIANGYIMHRTSVSKTVDNISVQYSVYGIFYTLIEGVPSDDRLFREGTQTRVFYNPAMPFVAYLKDKEQLKK